MKVELMKVIRKVSGNRCQQRDRLGYMAWVASPHCDVMVSGIFVASVTYHYRIYTGSTSNHVIACERQVGPVTGTLWPNTEQACCSLVHNLAASLLTMGSSGADYEVVPTWAALCKVQRCASHEV